MKKLLLLLGFFFCLNAQSQFWIDVSARGGWGPTLLINKNVFQDTDLTHKFSSGNTFGGRLGLNFGDEHSINFDISTVKFNQEFTSELITAPTTMSFSSTDFAFLYKRLLEGRYMEIGPLFSRINSPNIQEQNFGAILGFGRALIGNNRFSLNLGVRFRYIFTDILSTGVIPETGESAEQFHFQRTYESHESTTPLSANIVLDVEWAVGVFRTSSCYGKRKFVSF